MAEIKWIKICTDIFDDEKVLLIESMPEGDAILVIWFKLLCLAGKQNNGGVLVINDRIPYTEEMLATIFRRKIGTIRLALKTFESFGMVELVNDTITIPNWEKHQKVDELEKIREQNRQRKALSRERQRQLSHDGHVTVTRQECDSHATEKEEEFSLLKRLKKIETIADVCERARDNEKFSTACDEVLEALAFAGESGRSWTFGERTVTSDDFYRLATKPHGFDGNMLVETVNALIAPRDDMIADRRYYILGIIVNRFMR